MSDDSEMSSEGPTPFKIKYLQGENSGDRDNTDITKSSSESFFGSILTDVGRYAEAGKEFLKVSSAYQAGKTDENFLTNTIFFNRHPELDRAQRCCCCCCPTRGWIGCCCPVSGWGGCCCCCCCPASGCRGAGGVAPQEAPQEAPPPPDFGNTGQGGESDEMIMMTTEEEEEEENKVLVVEEI